MDREIAAQWYDHIILDFNFEFRNFTHNIPLASTSIIMSVRSSYITNSWQSSAINEESSDEIKNLRSLAKTTNYLDSTDVLFITQDDWLEEKSILSWSLLLEPSIQSI